MVILNILLVDFGSTYTKLTLVDMDKEEIIARSNGITTVETDVKVGYEEALSKMSEDLGYEVKPDKILACSSAAGGLKMIAIGLTKNLTAEAATREELAERLKYYADHFWLMFEEEKLIAFVDGMVTNQEDLTDEMYEKAEMHDEKGDWQMIFGVNTLPSYRKHGYAGELIKRAITDAKEQGRKGLVLTCKDRLISYYARFGFKNEGVSESVHGNVVWNQMRLTFDEGLGE